MSLPALLRFSCSNRRQILLLIAGHLLWSCALVGLWAFSRSLAAAPFWLSGGFVALQLYAAAQLLLPAVRLHPEERGRGFYLFWGGVLALSIWLLNQLPAAGMGQPLLAAIKSGWLLLVATLIGAALARYVRRLWEILPICIMMTLADLSSWLCGPTAGFAQQLQNYYLKPQGAPPLIDMLLIKLVLPGAAGLMPVFGISDWIMMVFFALVAARFKVNDNLLGSSAALLARRGGIGRYLPVPLVALFGVTQLAQQSGLFLPALPLIALILLLWYAGRYLLLRRGIGEAQGRG